MKTLFLWFALGTSAGACIVGCSAFQEEEVSVTPTEAVQLVDLTPEQQIAKLSELLGTTVKSIREENGKLIATLPSLVSEAASKAGSTTLSGVMKDPTKSGVMQAAWNGILAVMSVLRVRSDIKERKKNV